MNTDAALLRRVVRQRVDLLYGNALAVSGSALLMAAVVVVIAWPHTEHWKLGAWFSIVAAVQICLLALTARYRQTRELSDDAHAWGWRFALIEAVAGLLWGASAFVLVSAEYPLALALISACLAGRATLSVITHAHFPPALHAFVIPVFGLLALRFISLGGYDNASLGVMWIAVLGYLLLFVDRQARAVESHIRLRFEKEQLVSQLQQQNILAEQARERAEQASRSKSLFFAAANHDLRQPLHSLGLFATALRNSKVDAQGQHLIDQILQCTESLEQLFDNVLDISRLDAGQVQINKENVAIEAVFQRLRGTFMESAQDKNLRLSFRHPQQLLLHTDPTLLYRVLANLLANAIRYTDSGSILLLCRKREGYASIEVWDTGMGIPPEQHERIFEEFYQLNNPSRDRRRGLGLGLATVRRILQLLDHPLRLRSEVGRGTRFSIHIPLTDPSRVHAITATLEQKVPNLLGGKLILVIDDEASVRLGSASLLNSWGCECVVAECAAQALSLLDGRAPDFIIADLRLGAGGNGIEAIAAVRAELGESIPAVLVSGDTAPEQLRTVSAAGLTMMHKPLKPMRLRALLNHEFARTRRPD